MWAVRVQIIIGNIVNLEETSILNLTYCVNKKMGKNMTSMNVIIIKIMRYKIRILIIKILTLLTFVSSKDVEDFIHFA